MAAAEVELEAARDGAGAQASAKVDVPGPAVRGADVETNEVAVVHGGEVVARAAAAGAAEEARAGGAAMGPLPRELTVWRRSRGSSRRLIVPW